METSKILSVADKSKNEETSKKIRADNFLKSILIIFILLSITFLTSCFIPYREHGNRGGMNDHHGHNDRHGHNEQYH